MSKKILSIGLTGLSIFYHVDHFPSIGETISSKDFHLELGGKAFNAAYLLNKLKADVKLITTIGNDSFKNLLIDEISKVKMNTKINMINDSNIVASILVDKDGQNEVIVSSKVNFSKDFKKEIFEEIDKADILLLTKEIEKDLINEIIDYAILKNKEIAYNFSPVLNKDIILNDNIIYFVNEEEAKELLGESYIDKALNKNLRIIITKGMFGLTLVENSKITPISGLKVNSIDTTGAGDILMASTIYYYSKGLSLEESLFKANIIAASSTKYPYVLNSIDKIVKEIDD